MTVMSTLSMSMCTGNSCPHRWLVDSEWSSICLSKIWCCSLTVLNNGCCIWSDYRPMWVHLPFRLCWEFISTDVLNTVCSFENCVSLYPCAVHFTNYKVVPLFNLLRSDSTQVWLGILKFHCYFWVYASYYLLNYLLVMFFFFAKEIVSPFINWSRNSWPTA